MAISSSSLLCVVSMIVLISSSFFLSSSWLESMRWLLCSIDSCLNLTSCSRLFTLFSCWWKNMFCSLKAADFCDKISFCALKSSVIRFSFSSSCWTSLKACSAFGFSSSISWIRFWIFSWMSSLRKSAELSIWENCSFLVRTEMNSSFTILMAPWASSICCFKVLLRNRSSSRCLSSKPCLISSTFLVSSLISMSSFSRFLARPIFLPSKSPTDPPERLNLLFVTFPFLVMKVFPSSTGMVLISPSWT